MVRDIKGLVGELTDDETALVRTLTPAGPGAFGEAEHLLDLVDLLATDPLRRGHGGVRLRHRTDVGTAASRRCCSAAG